MSEMALRAIFQGSFENKAEIEKLIEILRNPEKILGNAYLELIKELAEFLEKNRDDFEECWQYMMKMPENLGSDEVRKPEETGGVTVYIRRLSEDEYWRLLEVDSKIRTYMEKLYTLLKLFDKPLSWERSVEQAGDNIVYKDKKVGREVHFDTYRRKIIVYER